MALHKETLQQQLPLQKLHHTYIVVGPRETAVVSVVDFLRDSFSLEHSYPDMWVKSYDSVGVDDTEEIASVHQRRPIGTNKKFIIFETSQITQQAQNSLLKMLEEPSAETHFFIVIPSVVMLLPTILSRVHVVTLDETDATSSQTSEVAEFLASSMGSRVAFVAGLLADYDKENITKEDIYSFVNGVEQMVHEEMLKKSSKDGAYGEAQQALAAVAHVQTYIRDTASSLKLLLEYLALRLPRL
ncbi:MAG: hypothetical protein RL094_432 [Candidatus Parcubacteria bacterium]|jgi:DNA polymerase III delta prime subunit